MRDSGALVLKLEYNNKIVHGARITIPLLGIDEHMGKVIRLDHLPSGTYDGTLTIYQTSGTESAKPVKIRIQAGVDTLQEYDLTSIPKEIVIRPVDSNLKTVLFTEVRIENTDPNFRVVRDEKGIVFKLKPGDYQVKMILPNLQVKTYPIKVTEETLVYTLPVDKATSTRNEPRFQLSIPVAYKTQDGEWVSTSTTNISSTGICLIKGNRTVRDRELYLRLFVPISRLPVECYAKVRWTHEESTKVPEMGLQLLLPEQTRETLGRWLQQKNTK